MSHTLFNAATLPPPCDPPPTSHQHTQRCPIEVTMSVGCAVGGGMMQTSMPGMAGMARCEAGAAPDAVPTVFLSSISFTTLIFFPFFLDPTTLVRASNHATCTHPHPIGRGHDDDDSNHSCNGD